MKIAVATDDGTTVSPHFGMAKHYLVVEVVDGAIKGRDLRPKMHHAPGRGAEHHSGDEHSLHGGMLSVVRDCGAIVARGMGRPMYEAILQAGITPYVTGINGIDDAVRAYIDGTLHDTPERLH